MASWLGHATKSFFSSPDSVALPTKDQQIGSVPLRSLCEEATPPCHLSPVLFNGHLQTFWVVGTRADPPIFYKRRVFENEDPDFAGAFAVDFVVPPFEDTDTELPPRTIYYKDEEFEKVGSTDDRPMLVILHGLAGGSQEIYLKAAIKPLVDQRWEACVVISRGCAKSKITSGVLYNARATWDIRQTVKWLRKTFPNRPLFGLGFSLGANILANYLGEEGDRCDLKAAVVCSAPFNLEASSHALKRTWMGLEVYSRAMGTSMKKLFQTHIDEIAKNPRVDIDKVMGVRYLYEFDRELQGPTWGYPSEGAYYRDASSCDSLLAIRVPFFALHAEDDPIVSPECLPFEEVKKNPYTVLCTTSLGGHLGWFEGGNKRWFAQPVSNFFNRMAYDIDLGKLEKSNDICVADVDRRGKPPADFVPMRRKLEIKHT